MGRSKLDKFEDTRNFPNFFQLETGQNLQDFQFPMRGNWNRDCFKNANPIVLELACGRGEYTVGMAERDASRNFIGIDRKGARMWKGSKYAVENQMDNVAFLRTQIQYLPRFFAEGEVSEIWITFPDPQPRNCKENKRLTSEFYLSIYRQVLAQDGRVHLKTDSDFFFDFTLETIERLHLPVHYLQRDIYHSGMPDARLEIKTYYENMWLEQGKAIHYVCFGL